MTLIRVVDTETTGIEEPAEMVEAGWTDVHITGSGQIIIDPSGPRSRLVRPGVPISFGAMAVHHISEAMVEAGDDPDAIRAKLAYGADILCAHNAAFDRRFIRGHNLPWICTFKGARTVWPELQSHSNGAIRYERGLCLHDARAMPSHRAGPDTWITAHILADLLSSVSVDQLIEICNNPVLQKKVGFGEHAGKLWADVPDSYLDWILNKSTMPSDPKKEDAVFTARAELARRGVKAELPSTPSIETPDPPPAEPEKLRGGRLARRAAIIGQEPAFFKFLAKKYGIDVRSDDEARQWICQTAGVTSRTELDHDSRAGREFEDIERSYALWMDGHD